MYDGNRLLVDAGCAETRVNPKRLQRAARLLRQQKRPLATATIDRE
jgi:hypothetical protein